jgi:plasmid stability protein
LTCHHSDVILVLMNVTIKDLPARLHRKLKAQAAANKRSINWEAIDILEKALESAPLDIEALLAEVERVQARLKVPPLSDDILRAAKNHGRP